MTSVMERVGAIHASKSKILAYLSRTSSSPSFLCVTQEEQRNLVELVHTIHSELALADDSLSCKLCSVE